MQFPHQVRPKDFKNWYYQLTCLTFRDTVGIKIASLPVSSLGKTLEGMPYMTWSTKNLIKSTSLLLGK